MAHENLPWSLVDGRERADDPRFWPAADLAEATFEGALIVDVDLSAAELTNATFEDCTLARLDLRDGQIQGATFKNCIIYRCDMRRAQFEDVTFENVTFDRCELSDGNFSGAKGSDLTLTRCELVRVDFRNATLDGVIAFSDLTETNFDDANLDGALVIRCRIRETTVPAAMKQCVAEGLSAQDRAGDHNVPWFLVLGDERSEPGDDDLEDVYFFEADLSDADFSNRRLRDVHFVRCNLSEANLSGATLDNVWFWECDVSHLNLSGATLERVTAMHSSGSLEASAATIHALHIEQGEHAESNFETASIACGSINMTDLRGSKFDSMKDLVVESYMADYTGCTFEGTDLDGLATERCHLDDGVETIEMEESKLKGNDEAGEIVGGVELSRFVEIEGTADVEPVPEESEEEADDSDAGDETAADADSSADDSEAGSEADSDADDSEADDEQEDLDEDSDSDDQDDDEDDEDEDEDEDEDDEDLDEDSDPDDSGESESKADSDDSKEDDDASTAVEKAKKEAPKGFFAKLIAFFKSLFGG